MTARILKTMQESLFLDEADKDENQQDQQEENEHGCYTCSAKVAVKLISDITRGCHLTTKRNLFCSSEHFLCTDINVVSNKRANVTVIQFAKRDGQSESVHKKNIVIDLNLADYNIIVYQKPKFTKEQIIERADKLMEEDNLKKNNVLTNDHSDSLSFESSEQFVNFCCTGYDLSDQKENKIQKIATRATSLLSLLQSRLHDFFCKGAKLSKRVSTFCVETMLFLPNLFLNVSKYLKIQKSKSFCKICKKDNLQSSKNNIISLIIGRVILVLSEFCPFGFIIRFIVSGGIAVFLKRKTILDFIKSFFNPDYTTKQVTDCSELKPGDVIVYKNWFTDTFSVIADKLKLKEKTELVIVHYHMKYFIRREVIEEKKLFKTSNPGLKKCIFPDKHHFEETEVVKRARSRIGDTEWGSPRFRSIHFCHWCKVNVFDNS